MFGGDYVTTVTFTGEAGGVVRIYAGSGGENGWRSAIPYVYMGSGGENGWRQAMPYVYKGSGGENGWHIST